MSGSVVIYCHPCRANHRLGQRDAEDVIQALIAELVTERCEGTVFTQWGREDRADQEIYEFCVLRDLSTWRDGEVLAEHLESMRESRLAAGEVQSNG